MIFRTHFFRWMTIPAFVVAALMEFAAMQRSKLQHRKSGLVTRWSA